MRVLSCRTHWTIGAIGIVKNEGWNKVKITAVDKFNNVSVKAGVDGYF